MSLTYKQAIQATAALTQIVESDEKEKYEFVPGMRAKIATRLRKVSKFQEEFQADNVALIKKYGGEKADPKTGEVIKGAFEVAETSENFPIFKKEQEVLLEEDTGFTFNTMPYQDFDNGKNKIDMALLGLMIEVGIVTDPDAE